MSPIEVDTPVADPIVLAAKESIGEPVFRNVSATKEQVEARKKAFFQKKSNQNVLPGMPTMVLGMILILCCWGLNIV